MISMRFKQKEEEKKDSLMIWWVLIHYRIFKAPLFTNWHASKWVSHPSFKVICGQFAYQHSSNTYDLKDPIFSPFQGAFMERENSALEFLFFRYQGIMRSHFLSFEKGVHVKSEEDSYPPLIHGFLLHTNTTSMSGLITWNLRPNKAQREPGPQEAQLDWHLLWI